MTLSQNHTAQWQAMQAWTSTSELSSHRSAWWKDRTSLLHVLSCLCRCSLCEPIPEHSWKNYGLYHNSWLRDGNVRCSRFVIESRPHYSPVPSPSIFLGGNKVHTPNPKCIECVLSGQIMMSFQCHSQQSCTGGFRFDPNRFNPSRNYLASDLKVGGV